jgi:hypothetical protein
MNNKNNRNMKKMLIIKTNHPKQLKSKHLIIQKMKNKLNLKNYCLNLRKNKFYNRKYYLRINLIKLRLKAI